MQDNLRSEIFTSLNDNLSLNQCIYISRIFLRKCSDIRDSAILVIYIRFAEMCLKKVTRFPTKHDVASEAVKKFPHILLRSYTERIEPAKCQNYFIQPVNSVRRDFFSRSDVCRHERSTSVSEQKIRADRFCIIITMV